jgi:hypothetical protein
MPIKSKKLQQTMRDEHVLLKVRSESGQTITAHADMIRAQGAAMLGKLGRPLGTPFMTLLNEQIENGFKTFLFLTLREGWNGPFVTYRCVLKRVHETLEPAKKALVPRYYAHECFHIRVWFEITSIERLTREEMSKIYVQSSGREIMSVVNTSGTVFRVGIKK